MSDKAAPLPVGAGWTFLEESSSVAVARVNKGGTIVATNRHAVTLIGEALVGQPWHAMIMNYCGEPLLADWIAAAGQPRRPLLNSRTSFGLMQTLEVTVEAAGDDYLLFGEVNAAEQAHLGREVLALNQEMSNLGRELALRNAELEQHRHHLEELVRSRTVALTMASAAADAAHRVSQERLLTEAEARMQARKTEAIGTLAAGIAHDFNTILGSIIGFAEMTSDDLPDGSVAKGNVTQILNASFRARDLILGILAFAREGLNEPVAVNVVAKTREILVLLRAALPPSMQLALRSGLDESAAGAFIHADPTQIQQIVMNLCINAASAMNNQGVIHIGIDPAAVIQHAPLQHVNDICLSVTDRGTGIPPALLERIFDPFFTTKAPGEGSGLGLSVVHGIVTALGGVIEVRSRTDSTSHGTEFRVFLPREKNHPDPGE